MNVNVKYFGEVVDRTQKSEEKIEVHGNELSELIQALNKQYFLSDLNLQVAVNEEIISNQNIALAENDEVALLPPFAGG